MTTKGEAEPFKPINYANEVQRLIHNNPLVYAAYQSHLSGQKTYTEFLEVAVYLLAEQNATLMEREKRRTMSTPANPPHTGAPKERE